MRPPSFALLGSLALCAASSAMAGTVNVSFVNAPGFTDAGTTSWDERSNLQTLATHLQRLGQRMLPADQVLTVEVLDVDLAGNLRPTRDGSMLRTLRRGADFPRMHLRYTLEAGGKTLRSGDEWVSDLNYGRGISGYRESQTLHHEKRMLDAWLAGVAQR